MCVQNYQMTKLKQNKLFLPLDGGLTALIKTRVIVNFVVCVCISVFVRIITDQISLSFLLARLCMSFL